MAGSRALLVAEAVSEKATCLALLALDWLRPGGGGKEPKPSAIVRALASTS